MLYPYKIDNYLSLFLQTYFNPTEQAEISLLGCLLQLWGIDLLLPDQVLVLSLLVLAQRVQVILAPALAQAAPRGASIVSVICWFRLCYCPTLDLVYFSLRCYIIVYIHSDLMILTHTKFIYSFRILSFVHYNRLEFNIFSCLQNKI